MYDELIKRLRKEQAAMAVANVISNSPTIIPAEEGET